MRTVLCILTVVVTSAFPASAQLYFEADRLICSVGIHEVTPSEPDVQYTDIHSSGHVKAFDRYGNYAGADALEAVHEIRNQANGILVDQDMELSYGEVFTYARGDNYPKGFAYEALLDGEDLDGSSFRGPAAPVHCSDLIMLESTQPPPVSPEPAPCTLRNEVDDNSCCQGTCTPLLFNLAGRSFELSGPQPPVAFDIDADGVADWISWTRADADEAFLALDRDGNGVIDNGTELFGAGTDQPVSAEPNGYLALAVFDDTEHGGNGDGAITAADAVFGDLLLWIDADRNGISEPWELRALVEEGVVEIGLDYRTDGRRDRWGNRFRWNGRASTESGRSLQTSDVIFVSAPSPDVSAGQTAAQLAPPAQSPAQ